MLLEFLAHYPYPKLFKKLNPEWKLKIFLDDKFLQNQFLSKKSMMYLDMFLVFCFSF